MGSGCQLGLRVVSAWAGRGGGALGVALDLCGKAGPARWERSKIRQLRQKHGPPTHHTVQAGDLVDCVAGRVSDSQAGCPQSAERHTYFLFFFFL